MEVIIGVGVALFLGLGVWFYCWLSITKEDEEEIKSFYNERRGRNRRRKP